MRSGHPDSINRTLLLVDDCVTERDLYELVLRPNFQILTAGRGVEGLAVAVAKRPDVIILDVMMPGIDGWETCTRIKGHPVTSNIPVILLTGSDDRDLSQHAHWIDLQSSRSVIPLSSISDTRTSRARG